MTQTPQRPENTFHNVLGFTHQYYTLWRVSKCWFPEVQDGTVLFYYPKINESYVQNLSKDYDEAQKIMEERFGDQWIEDLDLKGDYWTLTKAKAKEIADRMPNDRFKFGRFTGNLVAEHDDRRYTLWYVSALKDQYNEARIECMKLLAEKYDDLVIYNDELMTRDAYNEHIFQERKEELVASLEKGHHFNDGAKVELEVVILSQGGFDGYYGWTNIITFASKCGKILKYMGSASPNVIRYEDLMSDEDNRNEYTKITATIAHDRYNDQDETKLKRIKVKK